MSLYSIRKGESIVLNINVFDEANQAIDLTSPDITNILVTIGINNTVFPTGKYSLNTIADWNTLTVDTNIITMLASREQTKLWESGIADATVTIEKTDVVLTYSVYDFKVEEFIEILSSANSEYILNH